MNAASRIVTAAKRIVADGEVDLDAAFARAVSLHPCAPWGPPRREPPTPSREDHRP